uniref:uncharacterized protein LOC122596732 isoform X2 n=1 Tax=Erigeron canadensis TaxID=72917 RepID=UPI001CB8C087|nr:uncharacterized protein LOC122596732 isoform X2 [Erigeron canadensis]
MSPGKSETPYSALAPNNTPPPPQFYLLLPLYRPSNRRRYFAYAATILILAATIYFLYPSDPHLKVVNLRLDKFKIHKLSEIDIQLGVKIQIRNPDVYSLDYKSLNVCVEYRGEELGFVTSDGGKVKAFGTSYIDATLVLNGSEVVSEAFYLIEDLIKGEIPFVTTSEIRGNLGVLFFNLPIQREILAT